MTRTEGVANRMRMEKSPPSKSLKGFSTRCSMATTSSLFCLPMGGTFIVIETFKVI